MIIAMKFGPQIMKGLKKQPHQGEKSSNEILGVGSTFQPKELLNPTEKKLFKTLDQVLNAEKMRVFSKVKLDGLFQTDNQNASPLFSQLIADFLLMDLEIMEPALLIMIERPGNEQQLKSIREICAFGRLAVVTLPEQTSYDPNEVRERILQQQNTV